MIPYFLARREGLGLPLDPHRYWRLLISANQGDGGGCIVQEIEMAEDFAGENVCVGGTASASSEQSGAEASMAFNSSLHGNGWSTVSSTPGQWIEYDLGEGNERDIKEIRLFSPRIALVGSTPKDFEVQWSDDGSDWTTKWSVTDNLITASVPWEMFTQRHGSLVHPGTEGSLYGTHPYWRMYYTYNAPGSTVFLQTETQYRSTPGGINQATGGTADASAHNSSNVASRAFDGSLTTSWQSNIASPPVAWLEYNFTSAIVVAEVVMYVQDASFAPNQQPTNFVVQYSDDGTNWSSAWQVTGQTGWSQAETRVFTDPNYTA